MTASLFVFVVWCKTGSRVVVFSPKVMPVVQWVSALLCSFTGNAFPYIAYNPVRYQIDWSYTWVCPITL
ncbi:MAG: hypothetical protein KDI30_13250 [Pseudomonadales bacterium]|nr:hypothetical protein [Pseudomonadales bacterium]